MKVRTLVLNLLTLMPISSVAFAAGSELSALSNQQEITLDQVADLFDKRFFSNEFYNEAAGMGVRSAAELKASEDDSVKKTLLDFAKREFATVASARSGTRSPD